MSDPATKPDQTPGSSRFEREAEAADPGLLREFWDLLRHNKKWWLIPIIVVLLIIGVLVVLGSSAVAPFIYPLF